MDAVIAVSSSASVFTVRIVPVYVTGNADNCGNPASEFPYRLYETSIYVFVTNIFVGGVV